MSYRGTSTNRGRGASRGGRRAGPQLPSALLAEVDPSGSTSNRNRGRPRGTFASRPSRGGGAHRDEVRESLKQFNNARRSDVASSSTPTAKPERVKRLKSTPVPIEQPKKKRKVELSLPGAKVDDAEDGEIAWLEYMLRKEKRKEEDTMDDGLDDLLGFADLVGPGGSGLPVDAEASESEDMSDGDQEGDDDEEEDDEQEEGDGDEESDEGDDSVDDGAIQNDQNSLGGEGGDAGLRPSAEEKNVGIVTASVGTAAIGANAEASGSRYIPPHERAALLEAKARGDKAKEMERNKLERKAQGLLNKLSEANIDTMLAEIEGLYRDNSRNDVSTILTDLIINTIANRSNLLDSFVILYATLVGALHRIVGLEFGAHFVHATISKYRSADLSDTLPATLYETPDGSKTSMNLLTLIAHLYVAQVVGANLVYDLIRSFLTDAGPDAAVMTEHQVESLLRLVRCAGQQLRSDDPASLKDIVNLVQDKTKGKEKTMTTRARYMIETLVDLKGGKAKSAQNTDQDAANRMRNYLNGLARKRRVATTEPLRVSLQDFMNADTRGKWWLVGAGWNGNPLVEREKAVTKVSKTKPAVEDEEVLLEAARSQGMNTDVRRAVFVILMTSEDYIHACDRLSLLKFTEIQQREFVRVALHCAATEKSYNPYHTLIINHLCLESYSHRFTLQYALWDFLRELGDDAGKSAKMRCTNVAKTAAYVVGRGSLDLTVFKAIDFTGLKASGIHFFAVFISRLILATQTASPLFTLPKAFQIGAVDLEAIEDTFAKALTNFELSQGLVWVIRRKRAMDQGMGELSSVARSVVEQGAEIGTEVLSRAV